MLNLQSSFEYDPTRDITPAWNKYFHRNIYVQKYKLQYKILRFGNKYIYSDSEPVYDSSSQAFKG